MSGLQWAARQGPLAEENMRGIRFNLLDVKLHADSIHRGMGQIQPTSRRVCFGAALTADCRFMEPIFKCVIACPEAVVAGVQQAIMAKRGEMQYTEEKDGKTVIVAYLPIAETLGDDPFSKVLQTKTSGQALATYAFNHWQLIATNPLEKGSKAEQIMLEIRERKGLKVEHPDLADYIDRL
jgi:elongation factor 2